MGTKALLFREKTKHSKEDRSLLNYCIISFFVYIIAAMAVPWEPLGRGPSKREKIINNLRQIGTAGQQYMIDTGTNQVVYSDLIGQDIDLATSVKTINGEDYSRIVITPTTTQISVTTAEGTTITYDLSIKR